MNRGKHETNKHGNKRLTLPKNIHAFKKCSQLTENTMRLYYKNQQITASYSLGNDLLFTVTVTRHTDAMCVEKKTRSSLTS